MLDFEKVLNMTGFWGIDHGIEEILVAINENQNFQTLYSKKFKIDSDSINIGGKSYLDVTSTQNVWNELHNILVQVQKCCDYNNASVQITECEPGDNPNFNLNSQLEIGCKKDPDFFRIKFFRITIKSADMDLYDIFWKCIKTSFKIAIKK